MKQNIACLALLAAGIAISAPSASAQGFFQNMTKGFSGDWQGAYAGVGVSINETSMEFPDAVAQGSVDLASTPAVDFIFFPSYGFNRRGNSESYNLFAGYRVQKGNVVLGVEGDLTNGAEVEFPVANTQRCLNPNDGPGAGTCFEMSAGGSFETKGHLSGIVGYSVTGNALAYATVGAAFGENGKVTVFQRRSSSSGGGGSTSAVDHSGNVTGLSLGAGLETRISEHVSLRVSYQRDEFKGISTATQFGTPSGGGSGTNNGVTNAFSFNLGGEQTWTTDAVKIAALYQF